LLLRQPEVINRIINRYIHNPVNKTNRFPKAGRSDEGATGGDDGFESTRDSSLVPKQALQRQEATEQINGEANAKRDGENQRKFFLIKGQKSMIFYGLSFNIDF